MGAGVISCMVQRRPFCYFLLSDLPYRLPADLAAYFPGFWRGPVLDAEQPRVPQRLLLCIRLALRLQGLQSVSPIDPSAGQRDGRRDKGQCGEPVDGAVVSVSLNRLPIASVLVCVRTFIGQSEQRIGTSERIGAAASILNLWASRHPKVRGAAVSTPEPACAGRD